MSDTKEMVFEDLPIRKRSLVPTSPNQYRVVSAFGKEVKLIDATTAYEAFRLSGFTTAVKIERVSNLNVQLLEKTKFTDYSSFDMKAAFADVTPQQDEDLFAAIKLRHNPSLSADELDNLMHSLERIAASPAGDEGLVLGAIDTVATVSEGLVPSPVGMDVHGDGFDEIIPEQVARAPATAVKPAESSSVPKETPALSQGNELPPAKELTPEEVDRLLGGAE